MTDTTVTQQMIAEAEVVIRPFIRWTPLVRVDAADFGLPSAPLTLKLELLQHSGSFKARGAFSNLLARKIPKAGVVAASGGNHGAAVAYAANKLGIPATIFVPSTSSPAKIERIRGYGATLVVEGERYADALARSERRWDERQGASSRNLELRRICFERHAAPTGSTAALDHLRRLDVPPPSREMDGARRTG
jgi:threonine dehydratase